MLEAPSSNFYLKCTPPCSFWSWKGDGWPGFADAIFATPYSIPVRYYFIVWFFGGDWHAYKASLSFCIAFRKMCELGLMHLPFPKFFCLMEDYALDNNPEKAHDIL